MAISGSSENMELPSPGAPDGRAIPSRCTTDGTTPPELAGEMAAAIPGSRLAIIQGAGHLALLEQAGAMTRELVVWLSAPPE